MREWIVARALGALDRAESATERAMAPENLRIETTDQDGRWRPIFNEKEP